MLVVVGALSIMASSAQRPPPRSCDTFVVVAGPGGPACTLFGKNSDRPSEEEHEVVFVPPATHAPGSRVRCTHVEIAQAPSTLGVVLSRPSWLWGCEMGANEHGVVGGNEAVHSLLAAELGDEPRLLGMDLLRLALERGPTAREAADVCCALLEAHGQGGACSDDGGGWTYENGFLFADATEAYVLETAGVRHWALERVAAGCARNISNGLSIRTGALAVSDGLHALCRARGWWDGGAPFDWKAALEAGGRAHSSLEPRGRERAGAQHTAAVLERARSGALGADDARGWLGWQASVLRDEDSGICFRDAHGFCSTGSQLSWLRPGECSHLFTAASDPLSTCYKRFGFGEDARPGAGPSDFGSAELWRLWRGVALKGGLARAARSAAAAEGVREGLRALEEAALARAAGQQPGPTGAASQPLPFAAAVARETELLREALGK